MNEDNTTVVVITTITPPTTTTSIHRSKLMIVTVRSFLSIIVIVGIMLVAGGAVLLWDGGSYFYSSGGSLQTEDSSITTDVEGLVVATHDSAPCLPASMDEAFNGISVSNPSLRARRHPFETCYQWGNEVKYCWTKSYQWTHNGVIFSECAPDGSYWKAIDAKYVNPVTHPNSCGTPCQDMYQGGGNELNSKNDW